MHSVEIELIESSLTNGRIYFPASLQDFFPSDSFGDRTGDGKRGVPVEFKAGPYTFSSDIRISSAVRLSPRSSFGKYLKSVQATEGDKLRVSRVADRLYTVELLRLRAQ